MKKGIEKNLCKFAPQMYSVLKELQESASYWSEYDVPLGIVDRINEVLENVEAKGVTRKEYQKHKYDINEKLKERRKEKESLDNSVEITTMLGHKFK